MCTGSQLVELRVKRFDCVDEIAFAMIGRCVGDVERADIVDDGVDGGQPEGESVVVLDVHVVGGVIGEGVDVMFRVVVTLEDLVVESVEPLVDPRTVSRNVSRTRVFMCCSVLICCFLQEVQGLAIVDRLLGGGAIARVDVGVELCLRRQIQMVCGGREIAAHGEVG